MNFSKDTIGQVLRVRVKNSPDKPALIVKDGVYTWNDIDAITNYIARDMLHMGVKKGDHIGIIGINSDAWIFHYFATVKIGAVAVVFNTRFTQKEIERCIELTDITQIFYSRNFENKSYEEMMQNLLFPKTTVRHCLDMERSYEQWQAISLEGSKIHIETFDDESAIANILFTSGTTGNSKGVQLTHYSLVNNSKAMQEAMNWNSKDIMCVVVPLFHSFGITGCILAMLHGEGQMYLMQSTRTVDICQVIEQYRCTIMNGVPTMFLAMLRNDIRKNYDITSIKSGMIAGSQIFPQDYMDICSMFKDIKLQPSYGQTETSPCVSLCSLDDSMEIKANTVGKAINGVEIRIMRQNSNIICGHNVEGEVQVKGYNVMTGYVANPEETKQVFTADGFIKTGDLGYIREDGNLVITGRYKNLIIRGGENISPVEIEKAIKAVVKNLDVKVFGIPTAVLQEDIVACIEGREEGDMRAKIIAHLKETLSGYKMPQHIFFIEEMPKNSTGKINEKVLQNKIIAELNKSKKNK